MNLKLKFSHEFTNNPYLHSAVSKALNNFKIRRAQKVRNNQFLFQFFQNNEIFEIFKMFKKIVELTFTTQKGNVCSPWTACSVFNWKFFFLDKLDPKTQSYLFKLKFCTWTNSNMQNSMVMFTFSVSDWKYIFGQIWSKKSKLSISAEILHYTNLNKQDYVENMWCLLFVC